MIYYRGSMIVKRKIYSEESIDIKNRIKKAGVAGGVFGLLGGVTGGIATKSMKGFRNGAIIGAGIGSGLSLYGTYKINKDLKNKSILELKKIQDSEERLLKIKNLLPIKSYEEFYRKNPKIKKDLDESKLDYFNDSHLPSLDYLKKDKLNITRYLPLSYDNNYTILILYDLKDKKLKTWDSEISNNLNNLGSIKDIY